MNDEDHEATEDELAACALVYELTNSARIITYIGDLLAERIDQSDPPDAPPETVVIRRFIERVIPMLRAEGAGPCWQTARLGELGPGTTCDRFTARHGERRG